jgi:hypothetical protein
MLGAYAVGGEAIAGEPVVPIEALYGGFRKPKKKYQVHTKRGVIEVESLEQAAMVIRTAKAVAPVVLLEGIKVIVPKKPSVDYAAIEARMRADIQAELDDEEILLLM